MSERWYYRLFGDEFGPVSLGELHQIVQTGLISAEDEVRSETASQWQRAESIPELGSVSTAPRSSSPTAPPSATDAWFWRMGEFEHELGPLQFTELEVFAKSGQLTVSDDVKHGINGNWWKAGLLIRLTAVMPSASGSRETPIPADQVRPTSAKRPITSQPTVAPPVPKPKAQPPLIVGVKFTDAVPRRTPSPSAVVNTVVPEAAPITPAHDPVPQIAQNDVKTSTPEISHVELNRPSVSTNKTDVAASVVNIPRAASVPPTPQPVWKPPKEKWNIGDGLPVLQRLWDSARESESMPKLGAVVGLFGLIWMLSWLFTRGESGPRLFKATGLVTLNEKPLPNASVIFNPTLALTPSAKQSGKLATGRTDQSGRFVLYTDQRAGALPADYTVMLVATEEVIGAAQSQQDLLRRPPELKPGERPTLPKPPRSLIPEKYTNCKESGLSFPVSDTKGNYFDIKLTGEPPASITP